MSEPQVTTPPSTETPAPPTTRKPLIIIVSSLAAALLLVIIASVGISMWKKHEAAEAFNKAEVERRLTYENALADCEIEQGTYELLDDRNVIHFNRATKYDGAAADQVFCFLNELDAPQALATKIGQTRSLDGTREDTWGDYHAQWTYHPDDGLNLIIERTNLPQPPS